MDWFQVIGGLLVLWMMVKIVKALFQRWAQEDKQDKATLGAGPTPREKEWGRIDYDKVKSAQWWLTGKMINKGKSVQLVDDKEVVKSLLMDVRGALWECRDAIKENTAYLKQVYGDPKDGG